MSVEKENLLDIDNIISLLFESTVLSSEIIPGAQLIKISRAVQAIFSTEPILLRINSPIKVCGDIHGQMNDLLRIFFVCGRPPQSRYLFLGDYVDRGRNSLEVITLLFCLKLKYPDHIFLLRGNHESDTINRIYGFYDECSRKYDLRVWKAFCECFNYMPVTALISDRIICMHGGISPELKKTEDIEKLARPTAVGDGGLLCDLLWSDPDPSTFEFGANSRGVSYVFGKTPLIKFLNENDLDLLIRAHQVVQDGYEFFAEQRLITVFSAPNYCDEFDNSAAIIEIDHDLICSIRLLIPAEKELLINNE